MVTETVRSARYGMSPVWDDAPDEGFSSRHVLGRAFGAFYRRHEDGVWATSSPVSEIRGRGGPDRRDVRRGPHERARPAPKEEAAFAWLFGIARNQLAMSRRQGQVEVRARRRLGWRRSS